MNENNENIDNIYYIKANNIYIIKIRSNNARQYTNYIDNMSNYEIEPKYCNYYTSTFTILEIKDLNNKKYKSIDYRCKFIIDQSINHRLDFIINNSYYLKYEIICYKSYERAYNHMLIPNDYYKYINKKCNGIFKDYHSNGIISQRFYHNNFIKEGVEEYYNMFGDLIETKHYINGKLNGMRVIYYNNNKIMSIKSYIDNLEYGIQKYFSNEGILLNIRCYDSNQNIMYEKMFYDNGNLKYEKNNEGIEKEYNNNGILTYESKFINGKTYYNKKYNNDGSYTLFDYTNSVYTKYNYDKDNKIIRIEK